MTWRTPLVGRSAEIECLEDELRRAAAGEFRSLMILGEAGLGKTRLIEEFVSRHAGDVIALSARGHPLAVTDSFGLWAEALDRHLRQLDHDDVHAICEGLLDDLAVLLRTVAVAGGRAPEREPTRHRLLQALATVVRNIASGKPLVIVLDDVHQADASSWHGLHYLAHDLADARVLVVLAARPNELSEHPSAETATHALEQEGLLDRLRLAPMKPADLAALSEARLRRVPPAALVAWLQARSLGNPLFALGLLQALVDERADLNDPRLERIPEALADRIGQRLENLPPPVRQTLELLAVVGRATPAAELVQFAGQSAGSLDDALEALLRAQWIVEQERGSHMTFEIAHPLIQETIYQRIGAVRRRTLHGLVGRVLLGSGRLGEAAPHWAQSADVGNDAAIRVLRDAIRQAEERDAYREALTILAALVELLPAGDPRWMDVADTISWNAEWVVDRRADLHAVLGIQAMRELDRALASFSDAGRRAAVKFRLASFLTWGTGDLKEAERTCSEALQLFRQADDSASALLAENELGWISGTGGNLLALRAAAQRVAVAAEVSGERFALIHALAALAWAATTEGEFERAAETHARAIAVAREENRPYRVTWCLVMLALSRTLEGRPGDALALLDEARALNPRHEESVLGEWTIIAHWMSGDLPSALQNAREPLGWNPERLAKRRSLGIIFAAVAAVEMDDVGEAARYLHRLDSTFQGSDWWFFTWLSAWAAAVLDRHAGRLDQVGTTLADVVERLAATGAWAYLPFPALDLSEVAAERRDPDAARVAVSRVREVASRTDLVLHRGLLALTSACASLAASNMEEAAGHAREATELLASTPCRTFLGRAWDILGRSLAPSDRREATTALQQAATVFDTCGMRWRRERTLVALRGLGTGGRRVAAAYGPRTLTRREQEIVQLSAQGHTANDIAQRLFIGKRTVETHLANAYVKLGIRSKRELVQRAYEA